MNNLLGRLSVVVQEYVPQHLDEVDQAYALVRRLDTAFICDADLTIDDATTPLRAAWHLDTHLYLDTVSDAVHPRFHFQIGGEGYDDLDTDIRGVFIPEAPRTPVAPLDGILAIDFVLAHYCGRAWLDLRDTNGTFRHIRKAPIQRYWGPYFRTISDCIEALDRDPTGGVANSLVPSIFAA
jgi:hypothetical protein